MFKMKTEKGLFFFLVLLLFCGLSACDSPLETMDSPKPLFVEHEDFSTLAPIFEQKNDSIYVLNFWATTCPPCLKEMPHFERLNQEFESKKVRVLMINIDSRQYHDQRLMPFIKRKNLQLEIAALTDPNANKWTAKVNPEWWGALPYTVIYKNQLRNDFFGAFDTYESLKGEVSKLLN